MHRTDAPGNIAGSHTDGDPGGGIPPTQVDADIMNAVTFEIINFIESVGIALVKGTNTQLRDAISAVIGAGPGEKNLLINGSFRNWRVATDSSPASSYGASRWISDRGNGTGSVARIAMAVDEPGLPQMGATTARFFYRHDQTVATTVGIFPSLREKIENVRTGAGETLTLSFYAKLDPGDSAVSIAPTLRQNFAGGSASVNTPMAGIVVAGSAWVRYSTTVSLPDVSGKTIGTPGDDYLELDLEFPDLQLYTLDLWGIQLEVGGGASSFQIRTQVQNELLCERYFLKTYPGVGEPPSTTVEADGGFIGAYTDSSIESGLTYDLRQRFRVPMRKVPDVTFYSALDGATTADTVGRGANNVVVDAVHDTTESDTGYPEIQNTTSGLAYTKAHFIADAEFPTT